MPAVQRVGDKNSAGGAIQQGDSSILVNGLPVAINNALVSSHAPFGKPHPPHEAAHARASQTTIGANGKQIIVTGDVDTCGHARVGGSPDVTIG
jgi:uncharacterized Zn-binding protein involved in type VI secretion